MKMTMRTFAFPEETTEYYKAEATIRSVLEVCEFAARRLETDQIEYEGQGVKLRGYLRIPETGTLEMVVNAVDSESKLKLILHCSEGGEFYVNEQSNGARWEVLRDKNGTLFYTEELPD